uniref:MFS domain-containing protein n=1 Tax=Syphacia muris TaxID=451379 RepID=A0A0N5AW75_9BILA
MPRKNLELLVTWERRLWTINFFFGTCVLYASRVALPLCVKAVASEYRWNKSDSGIVLSCFFWGYACTQLFAGAAADFIGGERILRVSTFFWAILTFLTPQIFDFAFHQTNYPLFIMVIIRITFGISQGFHIPSVASIVSQHLTHSEKGKVFGICLAGSHFGTVIAGSVGSIILEYFEWRMLFQLIGIVSLLWWLLFRWLTSSYTMCNMWTMSPEKVTQKKAELDELHSNSNKSSLSSCITNVSLPWRSLFKSSAFWATAVANYCGANAYYMIWLPLYFAETFPRANSVVYNVTPSIAIVITSLLAPFIATQLNTTIPSLTVVRKIMEGFSLFGMAAALVLAANVYDFVTILILFTFAMAARGFHHGGVSVNVCDLAPQHTGIVYGIFNTFASVTGFVGVYITGCMLHFLNNNWSYVFVITAVQCVVGFSVYLCFGTASRII